MPVVAWRRVCSRYRWPRHRGSGGSASACGPRGGSGTDASRSASSRRPRHHVQGTGGGLRAVGRSGS